MSDPGPAVAQRTIVYVDGFNLYYRALKGTPYKWLDIMRLVKSVLRSSNDIHKIRYFTAMVSGKRDPEMPIRQQQFLRALRTIPEVEVHTGRFLASQKWAPLHLPPPEMFRPVPEVVSIVKTEEKGSDVNLASWLLRDAFRDEYDVAVVLSNDTDLVEPIRMVRHETGKPVGIMTPVNRPARSLTQVASFCRFLTPGRLAAAQFPDHLPGTTIRKPAAWIPD
ncbi:MAG: NYN domain-containing protein [Gemmatimonadales bacterium]|nr:NYN domain-containing protein [Gemmatimonadales bacterium]MDZ4388641.1 NYN domain-containing protein [Gemmatimonadales bacterium]